MLVSPFLFNDYRSYLSDALSKSQGKSLKSKLAKALSCQPSFLSQVLTEKTHLSLEHALKTADFLKISQDEKKYFLLLVQKDRSGTKDLQNYFENQLKDMKDLRDEIKEAVDFKSDIHLSDYGEYYSNWWYAAVHIAAGIPGLDATKDIAENLSLPFKVTDRTVQFLIKKGLIVIDEDGGLQRGENRIHIGSDSPLINSHHRNWRLKSLEDLSNFKTEDLRYSGVICVTKEDGVKIREIILNAIKKSESIMRKSGDEELFTLLLDFYNF